MSTNKLILYGALGIGVWYLFKHSSVSVSPPTVSVIPNNQVPHSAVPGQNTPTPGQSQTVQIVGTVANALPGILNSLGNMFGGGSNNIPETESGTGHWF